MGNFGRGLLSLVRASAKTGNNAKLLQTYAGGIYNVKLCAVLLKYYQSHVNLNNNSLGKKYHQK